MSGNTSTNEWDSSTKKEDLVATDYGKHHLLVQGPPRKPGQPVVLIIPGLGSRFETWYAVVRRLGPNVRTIQYNRAGLGKSETSPLPRTAENIALELEELLRIANIEPPYICAAQSYGGVIVREFIARCRKDDIVGLLLVDTNQEHTQERLQTPRGGNPMLSKINYMEAIGFKYSEHLTEEEAAIMEAADAGEAEDEKTVGAESENTHDSCTALGLKKQLERAILSPHPVTVIIGDMPRDFQRMLAYAKERGIGSESEVKDFEDWTARAVSMHENLLREQLQLSSNHRFVVPKNAGHNVQFWDPQIMADEILLIWNAIQAR